MLNPAAHLFLKKVLAALIGVMFATQVDAATNSAWFARAWQSEDGLPEHTIVGVEQTPDGYLWIATHRSLSRFDGIRFQEFAPATPESPRANQIRAMLLDRKGRVWLAKDEGNVVCVEAGKITQSYTLPATPAGAQARSMAEDAEGNIWIADSLGMVSRIHAGTVQGFGAEGGLAEQETCWIANDGRGQLWFSQGGRVGVFRGEQFVALQELDRVIHRIAPARDGGLWFCVGLTIFRCQKEGELREMAELNLERQAGQVTVTALYEDKSGGLWIGTSSGGLFRFDHQGIQSVATSHPNILNISEDSEHNIWVGTRGGGLNRLSPRAVQLVGPSSGLPFVAVLSACEDNAGRLWAAGQNGALACRSNGVWNLLSTNSGWTGGAVTCLGIQQDGPLFVGTRENGIYRFSDGAFVPLALNDQLPNWTVRGFYAAASGNLWAAGGSYVVELNFRSQSAKTYSLPPGVSDVRAMVQDASGDVWMGTTSDGRLLRVHGGELIDETDHILKESQHIRCLQVTADGSLWFGFAGQGLGRLKNGRFFQYRNGHGLWDEYISHILPDDRGRLWIAGNRGIFQVSRAELDAVAEGRAARVRSVVLGRGEGVPNLQATFGTCPAAGVTRDGRLLMPMLTGLAIVEPHTLQKNPVPPPVIIERLTVNRRLVAVYDLSDAGDANDGSGVFNLRDMTTPLRLGPGVEELEFEFTGLSLIAPENISFRYQLEGLDQDWVEAGAVRVARYPHVPPGEYRFRVTACNHDGLWNERGASVLLRVKPQLWEAGWFRGSVALGASGLLGGIVMISARRRYQRKLARLEQQQALERERARIAQDLHDDLGAGLVEINFGSELAQDPGLEPEEVREHTREIGVRAREMVTALDEIVWAVNPKHDSVSSLATYFCQFAQHFVKATAMRCHLDVARDLPSAPLNSEQRHSLFLAFKEALSNVVQHSGATDLRLEISATQKMLRISVSDNGHGLGAAVPPERNGADGLGNMKRRLEQLGGRFELVSHPGNGTTVIFEVPLHKAERRAAG